MARADTRRDKAARLKATAPKQLVYLPVPDEFLDIEGEPWSKLSKDRTLQEMDLRGVLQHTMRECPVHVAGDVHKALDLFEAIGDESTDGVITLSKDDYDWMMAHFREFIHTVWKAPDAAYLLRYLDNIKQDKAPHQEDVL